jgi:hypothetical protein
VSFYDPIPAGDLALTDSFEFPGPPVPLPPGPYPNWAPTQRREQSKVASARVAERDAVPVALNPGREARLRLAFYAAFDARDGDPDEYRRLIAEVVTCHQQVTAEQLAELGYLPDTVEGMSAVLAVADAIRALADDTGDADV